MKKIITIIGVLLIIFGIVTYSYKYFSYTTTEKVAQIGSVQVTNENQNIVFVPPAVSGLAVVVGVVLVGLGLSRKL